MKRLLTILTMVPGAAFAHPGHFEASAVAHDASHGGVILAVGLILAALALAWFRERGS